MVGFTTQIETPKETYTVDYEQAIKFAINGAEEGMRIDLRQGRL